MTKLEHIKNALREAIELAEKATPGPWDYHKTGYAIHGPDSGFICKTEYGDKDAAKRRNENATFIAHARTMTPLACRALLVAIEGLENVTCTEGVARNAITEIEALMTRNVPRCALNLDANAPRSSIELADKATPVAIEGPEALSIEVNVEAQDEVLRAYHLRL